MQQKVWWAKRGKSDTALPFASFLWHQMLHSFRAQTWGVESQADRKRQTYTEEIWVDVCRAVIEMLPALFCFFSLEIHSFAIRDDCPTFTLRQSRCVTCANGTESNCEQQTDMFEGNIQIFKTPPRLVALYIKRNIRSRSSVASETENGSQRNNCQSSHKKCFLLLFFLSSHVLSLIIVWGA